MMSKSHNLKNGPYRVSKLNGKRFRSPFSNRKSVRTFATLQPIPNNHHKFLNIPKHSSRPTSYNADEALMSVQNLISKGKELLNSIANRDDMFKSELEFQLAKDKARANYVEKLINETERDYYEGSIGPYSPTNSRYSDSSQFKNLDSQHEISPSIHSCNENDDELIILSESEENEGNYSVIDESFISKTTQPDISANKYDISHEKSDIDRFEEENNESHDSFTENMDSSVYDQNLQGEMSSTAENSSSSESNIEEYSLDNSLEESLLSSENVSNALENQDNNCDIGHNLGAKTYSESESLIPSDSASDDGNSGTHIEGKVERQVSIYQSNTGNSSTLSHSPGISTEPSEELEMSGPPSSGAGALENRLEEDAAHKDQYTTTGNGNIDNNTSDFDALTCLAAQVLDHEEHHSISILTDESDSQISNTENCVECMDISYDEDEDSNSRNDFGPEKINKVDDHKHINNRKDDFNNTDCDMVHTDTENPISLRPSKEFLQREGHFNEKVDLHSKNILINLETNAVSTETPNFSKGQEPLGPNSASNNTFDSLTSNYEGKSNLEPTSNVSCSDLPASKESISKYEVTFVPIESGTVKENDKYQSSSGNEPKYKSVFNEDPFKQEYSAKDTSSFSSILEGMGINDITNLVQKNHNQTVQMNATITSEKEVSTMNEKNGSFENNLSTAGLDNKNNYDENAKSMKNLKEPNSIQNKSPKLETNTFHQNYSLNHFTADAIYSQFPHTSHASSVKTENSHQVAALKSIKNNKNDTSQSTDIEQRLKYDFFTANSSFSSPTKKLTHDTQSDLPNPSPTLKIYKTVDSNSEGDIVKKIPLLSRSVSDVTENNTYNSSPRIRLNNVSRRIENNTKTKSELRTPIEQGTVTKMENMGFINASINSSINASEKESIHFYNDISRKLETSLKKIEDNISKNNDVDECTKHSTIAGDDDYTIPINIPLIKSPIKRNITRSPFKEPNELNNKELNDKELTDYVKSVFETDNHLESTKKPSLFPTLNTIKRVTMCSNSTNQNGDSLQIEEMTFTQKSADIEVQLINKEPEITTPSSPSHIPEQMEPDDIVRYKCTMIDEVKLDELPRSSDDYLNDYESNRNSNGIFSSISDNENYFSVQSSPRYENNCFIDASNEPFVNNSNVNDIDPILREDEMDNSSNEFSDTSSPSELEPYHSSNFLTEQNSLDVSKETTGTISDSSTSTLTHKKNRNQGPETSGEHGNTEQDARNYNDLGATAFFSFNELFHPSKKLGDIVSLPKALIKNHTGEFFLVRSALSNSINRVSSLTRRIKEIKTDYSSLFKSFRFTKDHSSRQWTKNNMNEQHTKESMSKLNADLVSTHSVEYASSLSKSETTALSHAANKKLDSNTCNSVGQSFTENMTDVVFESNIETNFISKLTDPPPPSKVFSHTHFGTVVARNNSRSKLSTSKRPCPAISNSRKMEPRKRRKRGRTRIITRNSGPKRFPKKR